MVGWIEYMGRFLQVSWVDGRSDLVVLPSPATGTASDLGVVCSAEVVTDAVLPLLDEHVHDVWVLVEHCPVLLGKRRRRSARRWVAGTGRMARPGSRSLTATDGERGGSGDVEEPHPAGTEAGADGDGLSHAVRVDHRGHLLPARQVVEVMMTIGAREYKRVSRDVRRTCGRTVVAP
jgi:hypothetical protein